VASAVVVTIGCLGVAAVAHPPTRVALGDGVAHLGVAVSSLVHQLPDSCATTVVAASKTALMTGIQSCPAGRVKAKSVEAKEIFTEADKAKLGGCITVDELNLENGFQLNCPSGYAVRRLSVPHVWEHEEKPAPRSVSCCPVVNLPAPVAFEKECKFLDPTSFGEELNCPAFTVMTGFEVSLGNCDGAQVRQSIRCARITQLASKLGKEPSLDLEASSCPKGQERFSVVVCDLANKLHEYKDLPQNTNLLNVKLVGDALGGWAYQSGLDMKLQKKEFNMGVEQTYTTCTDQVPKDSRFGFSIGTDNSYMYDVGHDDSIESQLGKTGTFNGMGNTATFSAKDGCVAADDKWYNRVHVGGDVFYAWGSCSQVCSA